MFQEGDRVSHFASELDNMCNVDTLESMVAIPLYDDENVLRGVIQLVNKQGGDRKITEQDIHEFNDL